jgi:hypothetical protein
MPKWPITAKKLRAGHNTIFNLEVRGGERTPGRQSS